MPGGRRRFAGRDDRPQSLTATNTRKFARSSTRPVEITRRSSRNSRGFDACFFCLGVTSAGMKEADYERVTYGMAVAAAEICPVSTRS